jgi:type I restriction enzyme S subunit
MKGNALIAHLKAYPEYKDSGLPWTQKIPAHWATERAKWLFTKVDRSVRLEDEVVTCFRDGTVTLRKNRRLRGFTEAIFELGYQGIRKGDLVIHAMDAFAGAVGVSDSDGKGSPVYAVCQPKPGINAHYFAHIIREMARSLWILALARGIRERSTDFRYDAFGKQRVPLPPPDEQTAIVRFLDHANRRLERAIRAKRKVIALLNEQKQAIIYRAVTRGIDPTVLLKPSGVSWLGKIPAHWEVWPFVRCAIEKADYRGATPEKVGSGVFLVTAKNIRMGWIDYERSKEYIRADQYARIMRRGMPRKGDILLTTEAPLGHLALVDREEIALAQRIIRFRLNPHRLMAEFALLSLMSPYFQNQLLERSTGSTAHGIKASKLPQLLVVCPPVKEQEAIVRQLEQELGPQNAVITRTEREIVLLREYRTRLIADVVTGKLDVREAALHLPIEADESETFIEADQLDEGEESFDGDVDMIAGDAKDGGE